MASRPKPNQINLGDVGSFDPNRLGRPSPGEAPSPQSGTIPPALSPLDAFALQGRILAAKFDDEDGRRISRLAPLTIASELSKPRPGYATSPQSPPASHDGQHTPRPSHPEPSGLSPEVAQTNDRHRSFYPSIQSTSDTNSYFGHDAVSVEKSGLESVSEEISPDSKTSDGLPRAESPESFGTFLHDEQDNAFAKPPYGAPRPAKSSTGDSSASTGSLAPPHPTSAGPQRSPRFQSTIRSVRMDSGDDSDAMSFHSDPFDLTIYERKPSFSNVRDRPRSPFSPPMVARRSPSISSEISNPDQPMHSRRSVNFSRPMSPAGRLQRPSTDSRPSFENSTRTLQIDNDSAVRPSFDSARGGRQDGRYRDVRPSFDHGLGMLGLESPPLRPSIDVVSIQDSDGSPSLAATPLPDEVADARPSQSHSDNNADNSYIYTKYALPRGRKVVSRTSIAAQDWLADKFNKWDQDASPSKQEGFPSEHTRTEESPKPANSIAKQTARQPREKARFHENLDDDNPAPMRAFHSRDLSHPDLVAITPPTPLQEEAPRPRSRSHDVASKPKNQPISTKSPALPMKMVSPDKPKPVFAAAPTLRQTEHKKSRSREELKQRNNSTASNHNRDGSGGEQLTPEVHLAKGISCHEEGALQKSTYHLRIAARGGNPTAMLLYALACRHGWGMRPNQTEGVLWLRKAVDLSKLEVAGDELLLAPPSMSEPATASPASAQSQKDPNSASSKAANASQLARKTHKAQLALAIYELGVSYMNGWGIATDKQLAVRCFDIAGGWGDADALAEAGFCYAKGVGCKKDLFKAASLYRKAEEKGIGMAGNSW